MIKNKLNNIKKTYILEKLKSTWDIEKRYWYPLEKCTRDDVISFDSEYINKSVKISFIKSILEEHGVVKLYEFREHGLAYEIDNISDYTLWQSDDYFMYNEGFWFDDTMNWIDDYSKTVLDESEYIYEVSQKHNKNGLELLKKVQKELGDKYTISYISSDSYLG
ncbi:hypothetical protein [Clostridium magnum]|uniref:Uncharacterized protein n=1 Tax=Clostridium magnum DSM 2767 TaxID=1121326 RepID=A0A161X467_9CLOT|nr:hypothetical protein [Clostridium magnum]KZL88646.1 hypothetical protein CLMAG_61390 [Clostridium magnum DSM 2767]KZL88891.1 hypothetical protein CLMAG_57950 [Clostridium magnum DSM 2767]SHI04137.1 hypothetical protein SAMN02745944_02200 [Clostridium magnum DSM 2767]